MIAAEELTGAGSALAGFDVTFIPGDPPRSGRFAAFRLDGGNGEDLRDDQLAGLGEQGTIELALPAAKSVRRRQVAATLLSIANALPLLLDLEDSQVTTTTARIWASVMTAGIGLIARGHLRPAISPSGVDAWRAGPLDPGDHILLEQLANAMPPLGHTVRLASPKPPLRVHSPAFLVAAVSGHARRHPPANGRGGDGQRFQLVCSHPVNAGNRVTALASRSIRRPR